MSGEDKELRDYLPGPETLARVHDEESVEGDLRRLAEDEGVREAVGALHQLAAKQNQPRDPEPSERIEYIAPVTVPPVVRPAHLTHSRIKLAPGVDLDPRQIVTQPSVQKVRQQVDADLARLPRTVGGKTARLPTPPATLTAEAAEVMAAASSAPTSSTPPQSHLPADLPAHDITTSVGEPSRNRRITVVVAILALGAVIAIFAIAAMSGPDHQTSTQLAETAAATFAPIEVPTAAPAPPSSSAARPQSEATPSPSSTGSTKGVATNPIKLRPRAAPSATAQAEPPTPAPAAAAAPTATTSTRPQSTRIHD